MKKKLHTLSLKRPIAKPEPTFESLQRPIKLQTPMINPRQTLDEEMDKWIDSISQSANNPQFNKVIEILRGDKELEPLLYDHKDLLEALSEIKTLTSKQMLSLISVAEKEYYESSYLERERFPSEEIEEIMGRLEEENKRRVDAEKLLAELRKSNESELVVLKAANKSLSEEKQELVKVIDEQTKYLKDLEKLQQELLEARSQKSSLLKSKEKLEEDGERSKKIIGELRQEISLLQQEKENLSRKLASTNSQTSSIQFNRKNIPTSPLKACSSTHNIKKSQSFDSSLPLNQNLGTLIMENKEESGQFVNTFTENSFGEKEKYKTQKFHAQASTPYSSFHNKLKDRINFPHIKFNEESLTGIKEDEKLKEVIRSLEKENQELTYKLQGMEQRIKESIALSKEQMAPTFARTTQNYDTDQLTKIFTMLDDIGDILRLQPIDLTYNKTKEPIDNLKEYVSTLRQLVINKEQSRELEKTIMEGKRMREKKRQWEDEVERLEYELSLLRDENEILRKQKYRSETIKSPLLVPEFFENQVQHANKLRDENLDLMEKYEKVIKENYDLRLQLRSAKIAPKREQSKNNSPHKAIGELTDHNLKLEEQILHNKQKLIQLNEKLLGYKERNELLKEELSLQKDKNRQLERQILSYVKRTSSLSQEATVNKYNYKSIAANYGHLTHTVKKLKKENKKLKEHVNRSIL